MLVVLDGTDGVGKSTLINAIQSKLTESCTPNIKIHLSSPKYQEVGYSLGCLETVVDFALQNPEQVVLVDRFLLSKYFFGKLYDQGGEVLAGYIKDFCEKLVNKLNGKHMMLINVYSRPEIIRDRLKDSKDNYDKLFLANMEKHVLGFMEANNTVYGWLPSSEDVTFASLQNNTLIDLEFNADMIYQKIYRNLYT